MPRAMRTGGLIAAAILAGGCIPQVGPPDIARPAPIDAPATGDRPVSTLPAPQPAWEARPVTPDARAIAATSYTVQPGDTLRAIGNRTGAGSEAIARANNLAAPYVIQPGQRLTIPGGRYHLVRQGETGIAIARAYGVLWGRIIAANALEEPFILRVGQRVLIPDAGPMTIEERARAFRIDVDDIVTGGEPALADNAAPARGVASSARVLPSDAAVAAPARLRGGFAWPVNGAIVTRFGPGASGERSNGIKIAAPLDTPVLATADGTVAYVGSGIPALGGLVILRHGDGWTSVYGHAGQLLVQRGQAVRRGQAIALSGNSGYADRPMLHFELRQGRDAVDPLTRLPPR